MSSLVVQELGIDSESTELFQELTPDSVDPQSVFAIRPHIYKHNNPTGSLRVKLLDANGGFIGQSDAIAISSIGTDNFFHGYIRFDITVSLMPGVAYRVALASEGGYSFNESAYIGWCKDFDLRKYDADFSPNAGLNSAFDCEVWIKRLFIKGSD